MPDICNIARHIHELDKGAANALQSLSITKSWALGQTQEEFVDKTIQFYSFLGQILTQNEKQDMGLDGLMMEYTLCKFLLHARRRRYKYNPVSLCLTLVT
jgi:hypothetical protein